MGDSFQHILPLEIDSESSKLEWNKKLYQTSLAVYFESLGMKREQVEEMAEAIPVVAKLVEKKSDLRSKMLSRLSEPSAGPSKALGAASPAPLPQNTIGLTFILNYKTAKVTEILDARTLSSAGSGEGQQVPLDLGELEKANLIESLQKQLCGRVVQELRMTFDPFVETEAASAAEPAPRKRYDIDATMVAFGLDHPEALKPELFYDGAHYSLIDHYCVNPTCLCFNITCVVLKWDPASQKDVAVSGFRYNLQDQKIKPFKDIPVKSNPSEWLKRFRIHCPIDLEDLFLARRKLLRAQYV